MTHSAMVASEPGNHSLAVLKRLKVLRTIEVELQSSDNFNQLPNVRALLQAYREGRLHWNLGLVTYWFEGVQLCEPRRSVGMNSRSSMRIIPVKPDFGWKE